MGTKCKLLVWEYCLPEDEEKKEQFRTIVIGAIQAIIKDCLADCGVWKHKYDILAFAQSQKLCIETDDSNDLLNMVAFMDGWFVSASEGDVELYKHIIEKDEYWDTITMEFEADVDEEIQFVFYPRPWFLLMLGAMLGYANFMDTVEIAPDNNSPFIISVDEDKIPAHIDVKDFGAMLVELCSRITHASEINEISIEESAARLFHHLKTTDTFADMPFAAFLEKVGGWVTIKEYKNGQLLARFITTDEMKKIAVGHYTLETMFYDEDEYLDSASDEEVEKSMFVFDKHEPNITRVDMNNKKENE